MVCEKTREQIREQTLWFVGKLVSKLREQTPCRRCDLDRDEVGHLTVKGRRKKSVPEEEVACSDSVQGMFVARI